MARETRLAEGAVDANHFGFEITPGHSRLMGESFLLHSIGGTRFLYRKGAGIVMDQRDAHDTSDVSLWLNGSIYAAIASINGLVPMHASAVACEGRVFAFTGPSGAGKSTLVTALGAHGLPMFCDDTLVLDMSGPDGLLCLPGHKRLKLTPEAIALTGAEPEEKVADIVDKFYARPPAGEVGRVLPFGQLIFIEEGPETSIEPISGAERIARMQDEHYTTLLFAMARDLDLAGQFAHYARLVRHMPMARFTRPRDTARFDDDVATMAQYVKAQASNTEAMPE